MWERGNRLGAFSYYTLGVLPVYLVCWSWVLNGDVILPIQRILLGLFGGLLGIALSLALAEWLKPSAQAQAQTTQEQPMTSSKDPTQNVTSYNQSGGITAGIVNVGPQRLAFSPDLGHQLLTNMPDKNKPVRLNGVGGDADQAVVMQIESFLRENGYQVERNRAGMMAPPPDQKVVLNPTAERYILIIAPSAN